MAASFLLALGTAACSADASSGGSAANDASGPPTRGGTLTYAASIEPDCFDPHVSMADITAVLMRNVFDSLVSETSDGTFKPWLASEWKVSPDSLSYTFTLRENVLFSDGSPLDATAVKANLDRIAAPETKSLYARQLLGPYAGTDVVDARTAVVRLREPYAPFLHGISTTYLGLRSPATFAGGAGDQLCAGGTGQVGSGPFTFTSYTKGQQAVFARNQAYAWGPADAAHTGPAYLDKLVVRFLPQDAVRVGAVTSGQVDVAEKIPAANLQALGADRTVQLLRKDAPGVGYTWFFNTSSPPFDDSRTRLAVRAAVDLEHIVKAVYFNQYKQAFSVLSPSTPGYDPATSNAPAYDRATADRLLDEAGWSARDSAGFRTKDGRRFAVDLLFQPEYTSADRTSLDTALQADLKKVGIELRLVPLHNAEYTPKRNRGEYHMVGFAWGGAEPDLLRVLFASDNQFTDGGANATRLRDPQIDEWLTRASTASDLETRKGLYAQVQQKLAREGLVLPTAVLSKDIAARRGVHGLRLDANAWPLFLDAWVERR
ncbi:ABC transporter substrate-binding protein [Embleya sp. NBC_00888]|uniref:ABC transporter substrate-binding protein n=1 Tax=Embleya sp. NBC_00888 TaxID=2975960 RepID=UPI00386D50D9|nr:ABC transporter substrate-binding protein [Embleya sp. NBC_00888]